MSVTCQNCGCVMVGDKSVPAHQLSPSTQLALTMEDGENLSVPMRCPICSEPPHRQFYACGVCGSTKVMVKEWVDPNEEIIGPVPEITNLVSVTLDIEDDLVASRLLDAEDEVLSELGFCLESLTPVNENPSVGQPSMACQFNDDPGLIPIVILQRDVLLRHQLICRDAYDKEQADFREEYGDDLDIPLGD